VAEALRHRAADPKGDQRELWSRMLFNILVGNTDDHARNHAWFWDGAAVRLTPAYDIDPRPRLGREANQAMVVNGDDRRALIATAIAGAGQFGLRTDEAVSIAKGQIQSIRANFRRVATEAGISIDLQNLLAGRAFLNSYVFEGAPAELPVLDAPL
jgi:serine/threonine-protein kinase HipA